MTTIRKEDFGFLRIYDDCVDNFKEVEYFDLSEFHEAAIKWVGDAIRPKESQWFWNGGEYCWFPDSDQSSVQRLWVTCNGILMFEDCAKNELYRVSFK